MAERLHFSTFQRLGGGDLREGEIIEAEYVTLDCRPREGRAVVLTALTPAPAAAPAGIGMLRGDAGVAHSGSSRAGAIFWLVGTVLIAASFWIAGGHALISGG
jgi:hypothetical protein